MSFIAGENSIGIRITRYWSEMACVVRGISAKTRTVYSWETRTGRNAQSKWIGKYVCDSYICPMLSKWDSSVHTVKIEFLPLLGILLNYTFSHLYCWLKFCNQTVLSEVMAIWSLGYWKYEMEKSAFKVWGLSLCQLPTGPEVIKITPFRLQISI